MANVNSNSAPRRIRRFRKNLKLKYYSQIDIPVGKVLFKNTAGLKFNLQGSLKNYKIRKNSVKDLQAHHLATHGYADLGNPHSPELIKKIREKFDEQIEDKNYSIIRSHYNGKVYGRMLFNAHKNIPELKELLNEQVVSLLENYYGKFKVYRIFGLRNYHVPDDISKEREMLSSSWHCDQTNTARVKMMVYLTNVEEKDGPFFAQTKERTGQLVKMGFSTRDQPKIPQTEIENPKYAMKFVGPSGTTLMCNTGLCLHRATLPKEGNYRDVIHFQFEPSNSVGKNDWYDHIRDDNTLFSLERNNKLD